MNVALMVITDGRGDCLQRTLDSIGEHMAGKFEPLIMVDDSVDPEYAKWLDTEYPGFERLHLPQKAGFCGAIQAGWERLRRDEVEWVLHLEDDFELVAHIDVKELADVMIEHPYVAQMALKRQPVNDIERAAGDLVNMWPLDFEDRHDSTPWLAHRLWFTTNVCLYRASLLKKQWPDPPRCEEAFGQMLLKDGFDDIPGDQVRFGLWGDRHDPPKIIHIGERRGSGY